MKYQRTIKKRVSFKGIGLHTGRVSRVTLRPAPQDTGVVFLRTDRNAMIRASLSSVVDTAFATTLGCNGTRIKTVEHLLSALTGLGIDNLIIEVDGPEIPILDGSSIPLVDILLEAGIKSLKQRKDVIKITSPVCLQDGHINIVALPYDGLRITYTIHFKHPVFKNQTFSLDLAEERFVNDVAPARTFGFLKNVEMLRANGLALGGSLDNAVVIDEDGILNPEGLRFEDEFVRHKVLDLIGDLCLLGYPIEGHIIAERAGHSSHIKFLKTLINSPECWKVKTPEAVEVVSYAYA